MAERFFELGHTIYDELVNIPHLRGEVVIDDRTKLTVGRRLNEAERIGYPYVVVIGKRVSLM
jgi:prolyl-tRNA synthetase